MFKFRITRLFMWMGLAALATYLMDPERGEQRRKDLRKQVVQIQKRGKKLSKKTGLAG